jgi:hypothetical protein
LIFCDKHPDKNTSKFCRKNQSLICDGCFFEDYIDHMNECKDIFDERISEFLKKYQTVLMSFKDKIIALDEQVTSFLNR